MCTYCGADDGCRPVGGKLIDQPDLSKDDWRKIYNFVKYVYLPFVHGILADANRRWRDERRRAKKETAEE